MGDHIRSRHLLTLWFFNLGWLLFEVGLLIKGITVFNNTLWHLMTHFRNLWHFVTFKSITTCKSKSHTMSQNVKKDCNIFKNDFLWLFCFQIFKCDVLWLLRNYLWHYVTQNFDVTFHDILQIFYELMWPFVIYYILSNASSLWLFLTFVQFLMTFQSHPQKTFENYNYVVVSKVQKTIF